jgi:hypothetical protein
MPAPDYSSSRAASGHWRGGGGIRKQMFDGMQNFFAVSRFI